MISIFQNKLCFFLIESAHKCLCVCACVCMCVRECVWVSLKEQCWIYFKIINYTRAWYRIFPKKSFICIVLAYGLYPSCKTSHGVLSFTRSIRGNTILQLEGQSFTLNRHKKNTCYWECLKKRNRSIKCNARIVTNDGDIKFVRGVHNHKWETGCHRQHNV